MVYSFSEWILKILNQEKNYDLRYYLEKNWEKVGPKVIGKLNIYAGHMDNFYLNVGVYHMADFLENTTDPYYNGSITYGERGGHGWRPFDENRGKNSAELLLIMAKEILKNAPFNSDDVFRIKR